MYKLQVTVDIFHISRTHCFLSKLPIPIAGHAESVPKARLVFGHKYSCVIVVEFTHIKII